MWYISQKYDYVYMVSGGHEGQEKRACFKRLVSERVEGSIAFFFF